METLLEEKASLTRPGGSLYIRISPTFAKFIGIEINANNEIISDTKICMGTSKHGKFLYTYSPKQQKQYIKQKLAEEKEQTQLKEE